MPTLKQRKFAKHYSETGNATEAALFAYNTEDRHVAEVIGYENLRKPVVQSLLEDLLPRDLIISSLVEDILSKPGNRIQELRLAMLIRGMIPKISTSDNSAEIVRVQIL